MNVTINGKEYILKYSFRSLMIFENITGEIFTPNTITNIILYFYSTVMASDKDSTLSFNDFNDWLDANPDELTNFTNWLVQIGNKNTFINGNTDNQTEVEPKKE